MLGSNYPGSIYPAGRFLGADSSTPEYGWGLYGSPWGTYADLSSAYFTPERITRDRFERVVAASTAIGKDDTELYTWADSSSSLVTLNGHQLVFKGTTTTQTYRPTLPVALQDGRVFMQWEFDTDLPVGNDDYSVSIIFRKTSSTVWYRWLFNMQPGGANAWSLQKTSNGGSTYTNLTTTDIGTQEIVSPLPLAAGDNKINMLVDFSGTLLRAKTWDAAESEPGWTTLSNDSSISAAGDIGIEIQTGLNETTFPKVKVNYITVTNSVTTAQVTGAGVPSSSDHEASTDAASVTGTGVISASEHAAYHDAATVTGAGVPSATEAGAAADSATVIGAAVISSSDQAAYVDAATSQGAGVPSSSDQEAATDAATVIAAAVISSTDTAAYADAATVSGAGVPSSTDQAAYVDSATAQGAGVPSSSDEVVSSDADTVIAVAVISATEHAAYHDAATVSGAGVPSSSDEQAALDAATVRGIAVISAVEHAHYVDANTVIGIGVISSVEDYEPAQAAQAYTDEATVIGHGIISSHEVFKTAPPAFSRRIRGFQLSGKMTISLGVG